MVLLLIITIVVGLTIGYLHNRLFPISRSEQHQYLIIGVVGSILGAIVGGLYNGILALLISVFGAVGAVMIRKKLTRVASSTSSRSYLSQQSLSTQELIDRSIKISETVRSEEPLGEDQRVIDNLNSSIQVSREFTVSKEWSKSYTLGYEQTNTSRGEIGFNLLNQVNFKLSIEEALKAQYGISEQATRTYSEKVSLEVPARTKIHVLFKWKRIWQHGFISFRSTEGQIIQIPFQIVVGLTFDQIQTDGIESQPDSVPHNPAPLMSDTPQHFLVPKPLVDPHKDARVHIAEALRMHREEVAKGDYESAELALIEYRERLEAELEILGFAGSDLDNMTQREITELGRREGLIE